MEYPLISDSGKRYRHITDDIVEYESGVQYDIKAKHIVKGMITKDNTRAMVDASIEKRENNRIIAALRGAGVAINSQMDLTPYKGLSERDIVTACLVERMTEQALAGDGHASVKAQENALRMIDSWPERSRDVPQNVTINVIDGDQAARLRGIVGLQVVDAEFTEDV